MAIPHQDQCMEAHKQKQLTSEQTSIHFTRHHQVHLKREKRKEEEQRRKQWVDQERQKTLSRLRSFREKQPGHYIKTLQSKKPPSEFLCPSQPLSIVSLDPSLSPDQSSARPAGSSRKTSKKQQPHKPKDISVHIYSPPPPPTCPPPPPPTCPPPPPPICPPPPPPLPPPPIHALPHSQDAPVPLSEKADTPFPAKNTLKQNIGTMDEVLASLHRGEIQLRKVPAPVPAPSPNDFRSNLMSAIRQGVTLKKVVLGHTNVQSSEENELERSIKAAMMRMKKVSANSDEEQEDEGSLSIEWEG